MVSRKRRNPAILKISRKKIERTYCHPCGESTRIEKHYYETRQLGEIKHKNRTLFLFVPLPCALLIQQMHVGIGKIVNIADNFFTHSVVNFLIQNKGRRKRRHTNF